MSLTTVLANPDSKFSIFLDFIMHKQAVSKLLGQWNNYLYRQKTLKVDGVQNPALVGTAFDYAFRWHVGGAMMQDQGKKLVAYLGATHLDKRDSDGNKHRDIISKMVTLGCAKPQVIADISIVLAWYERIYREGAIPPEIVYAMGEPKLGPALLRSVPTPERDDVKQLIDSIDDIWHMSEMSLMLEYNPNPIIPNANWVGGADADWIFSDTLYDCKCSWKARPFTEKHLKQVVGYALLDWDNKLELTGLGWYYARQKTRIEYPIEKLITDVAGKRAELKEILQKQYLARIDLLTKAQDRGLLNRIVNHMELSMQAPIQELAHLLDDASFERLADLLEKKRIIHLPNHMALREELDRTFWKHHEGFLPDVDDVFDDDLDDMFDGWG
jgi:hypothetical protein